ncbi:MAG: alpha/beta fold hydrolase [Hyphomicrobiaceae bacterium]
MRPETPSPAAIPIALKWSTETGKATTAFLCADLAVTPMLRDDHAHYIDHWLKIMKGDKKAIFTARDGARRVYRQYGGGEDLLVFMHGSGGDSRHLARFATHLAAEAGIRIVTLDMRGRGEKPIRRGDVNHVDQQEWDIADLVKPVSAEEPVQRFFVGEHSIGGGLALRYASGNEMLKPDAVILLPPYVSRKSPSSRQGSGGWAQPRVSRFAGIEMLHRVGIHAFDQLPVVEFAVSPSRRDGFETPHYSWRLFNSVIPRSDWRADIARISAPILVLGAEKDVILRSEGCAAAFYGSRNTTVEIVQTLGISSLVFQMKRRRKLDVD